MAAIHLATDVGGHCLGCGDREAIPAPVPDDPEVEGERVDGDADPVGVMIVRAYRVVELQVPSFQGDSLEPCLPGVAWGGGHFVAAGYWQDSILHSRDGEVWQEASQRGRLYGLMDLVWDGRRFVAVGSTIGYSADGDRWQKARTSVTGEFHAVTWNGARYVAVGHDGLIMHSDDGDRWERAVDSATEETLEDVAWNGERFVAVGFHGAIVHSSDGMRWQPARRPAVPFRAAQADDDPEQIYYLFSGIAWNGERFAAVGWGGNDRVGTVVHSSDGDRWRLARDHKKLAAADFQAVAWNGERFVAVSYDGVTMYSADGDRWEPAHMIPPPSIRCTTLPGGMAALWRWERTGPSSSVRDRRRPRLLAGRGRATLR